MPALPPIPPARRPRSERGGVRGMLAVIFWCACGITAVPLAGLFTLISALGPQGAMSAIADSLSGSTLSVQVLRLGLVPQVLLFVWSASFVGLTIARSRHALIAAPALLALDVVASAVCQFSIRGLIAPDDTTFMDLAALMPAILVQAAGAAALYGYFREGTQPRDYYVR